MWNELSCVRLIECVRSHPCVCVRECRKFQVCCVEPRCRLCSVCRANAIALRSADYFLFMVLFSHSFFFLFVVLFCRLSNTNNADSRPPTAKQQMIFHDSVQNESSRQPTTIAFSLIRKFKTNWVNCRQMRVRPATKQRTHKKKKHRKDVDNVGRVRKNNGKNVCIHVERLSTHLFTYMIESYPSLKAWLNYMSKKSLEKFSAALDIIFAIA